jgi:CBS domain-containing protein
VKLSLAFTPGVVTAAPDAPLGLIGALLGDHNIGAVVIAEDRRPVGIITDRDLALALGAKGHALHTAARDIMSHPVLAIPDGTDICIATRHMRDRHVRRLPVVDADDRLVGMVTLDDLFVVLGRELANLAESVGDEVHVR